MSSTLEVKQEDVAMQDQGGEQPDTKRKAEEEAGARDAAGDGGAQPTAKVQKTDGDQADGEIADNEAREGPAPSPAQQPVTIGYKTFVTSKDCFNYYFNLISKLRKYQNLNDYEFHMVHDLIKTGHPDAARKLEGGVRAIQIREVEIGSNVTSCFFITHDDGSDEDVSYRKCLANLFPDLKSLASGNTSGGPRNARGGRGGGRFGGRGGRGGGRGGWSGGRSSRSSK